MLWFFLSLKADGLDSGESSAEPPHLANISVSVRVLTGTNRLLMTQATPAVGEYTKTVVLQLFACNEVFFYIYRCQRTQTIHTQNKQLSDQKNNSSGRQHSLMIVVPYLDNESRLICVKHNQWGNLFWTKLFLFFWNNICWGFGFTITTFILERTVLWCWSVSFCLSSQGRWPPTQSRVMLSVSACWKGRFSPPLLPSCFLWRGHVMCM